MSNSASRVREIISVAASCAVITAALEVAGLAFRQQILGRIVFVSSDYAWMTPLAYLFLVVPAALIVDLVLRLAGRPLPLATLIGVLSAVLVFSLLVPYSAIAWWASAVLAAGTGYQVKRLALGADPARWIPRLRLLAAIVAVPLVLTGVGVRIAHASAEKRSVASLTTPPRNAPNVLLLVMDTVRSKNLDLYGYQRPTAPELRRLAETSTVFDFAFSTSSWTLPSHASLFTGLPSASLDGADWIRPLAPGQRVIAEAFHDHGYATGGFAANLNYTSYESGLTRGFSRYEDYRFSWPLLFLHSGFARIDFKSKLPQARSLSAGWNALIHSRIDPRTFITADVFSSADEITREFLDWQTTVGERPFFAFLNFFDAHEPYRPAEDFRRRFVRNGSDTVGRYDAAIASIDDAIGRTLRVLQERGVLDNTVLIVTADHGEAFGEHGLTTHGNSLYLETLRVPLIVRFPGVVPAGRRIETAVSLADVASTLLDLAHLTDTGVAGRPLSELWRSDPQPPERDIAAHLTKGVNVSARDKNSQGAMTSRMDARFHYIRNPDGTEELYDYRADPDERRNIAADSASLTDLVRLRAAARR
jgi:arylsulfatase A-like enzyme